MAKANKSNELLYNVTFFNDGIQRLDGDAVSNSDGSVVFRYRRRGSSSYEQRVIAKSAIVALGKDFVLFRDRVAVLRITKANVSPAKDGKLEVTWADTKGNANSAIVDAAAAEVVTMKDTKVSAPEGTAKAKKKKSKK